MSKQLSTIEETRRNQCEREIREAIATGLRATHAIGAALRRIRDEKLYRGDNETFEDYCTESWRFSKQRAYQLIGQADLADLARAEKVNNLLTFSEGATRPIAALPSEEVQRDAIREAVKMAADNEEELAPKHLKAAAAKFAPPKPRAPRPLPPLVPEFADPVFQQEAAASPSISSEASTPAALEGSGELRLAGRWSTPEEMAADLKPLAGEIRRLCDGRAGPLVTQLLGIARSIEAAQLRLVG